MWPVTMRLAMPDHAPCQAKYKWYVHKSRTTRLDAVNATCEGTWRGRPGVAARPLLHGGTQKRMLCAAVKSARRTDDVKPPKCTLTGLQPLPDIRRRPPTEHDGRALHGLYAPSVRGAVGSEARGRHRRPLANGARPRLRPDRLVLVDHHPSSCSPAALGVTLSSASGFT